ncbi:MAG TPA: hypothetical protein VFH49_00210, partial [Aquabacterium sp.]|nr:hypothetical protein [Aquabacterium sp.]
LTGTASLGTYQTALRSVTYINLSDNPSTGNRTISAQVSNGGTVNPLSELASRDVQISSTPDTPAIQTSTTALTYVENAGDLVIDAGLQLSDADSTSLISATVQITSGYMTGRDQLVFVDGHGITGSWTASTGTLTLSGTASVADYQNALRSVIYRHAGNDPGSADRVIAFSVNDGGLDSLSATRTVHMVPINDAPVLTMNIVSRVYEENTAPIQVAPTLTLVDPDNTQLSSATVRIASAYALGEDVLLFTDAYGITGQWDVDQGLLTLNGLASVEDYQLALRSVSYQNLSEAPDAQARTLELQVSDSGLSSNVGTCTLTVLTQPDAPVVTPGVSQITYVENATPLQVMGAALLITDVDSTALSRAVITISTAYVQGQDTLTFVDQAGITGTWSENTGTLTLSGYASLSDWQAALQSIRYVNSSDRPSETARDLTLTVHDGSVDSAPVTWRLDVQAVNDTPVLSSDGVTPSYTENAASIAVADGLTISDLDHDVLSQATIHIVGHVPAQDLLSFTNSGDITGQWDADLGTLTLSGNASLAD